MIPVVIILLLTFLQFWAGFGVFHLYRIRLKPGLCIPLSVLTGLAVFSFVPFLLQLLSIPLTRVSVFGALVSVCVALNPGFRKKPLFPTQVRTKFRFRVRLYELPFLAVMAFIVFVSVWRCFYYPPTPRDLTSGPEVIAEYAVREKTMINSVFTVSLETTNNQFKPPYITSLQIIYKLAGFPFGQIWLSTLVIAFVVFLYGALSQHIHRLLAGMILLAFLSIPEMYAYTIMVLFDYSNAVFFCVAVYFLVEYLQSRQRNCLRFAALLMGIATYVRSETLVLAGLTAFALIASLLRQKERRWRAWASILLFLLPSILIYLLSVTVYIGYYLPVSYPVEHLVNKHLFNLLAFFDRFRQMNTALIFSSTGVEFYGYFVYLFLVILFLDTVVHRRWSVAGRNFLFTVAVVYIGLPFLGHLLPLMDMENSTKRGLFKIFPLMLLYMSRSQSLIHLSKRISDWETRRV